MNPNGSTPKRNGRRFAASIIVVALVGMLVGIGSIRTATAPEQVTFTQVAPASLPATIRVGSFNIHSGADEKGHRDLALTARTLEGLDIVAMQEVAGALTGPDEALELGKLTGLQAAFFPTERRFWHDSFGNAILSRLPISSYQRSPLKSPAAGTRRNVAIVHIADDKLTVVLTHITRSADRQLQLQAVADEFLKQPEPAILLGDLNTTTADDPTLAGLLSHPGVLNPLDSIHRDLAGKHIDWILVRGMTIRNAGTKDLGASDHPLVWAELAFHERPTTAPVSQEPQR